MHDPNGNSYVPGLLENTAGFCDETQQSVTMSCQSRLQRHGQRAADHLGANQAAAMPVMCVLALGTITVKPFDKKTFNVPSRKKAIKAPQHYQIKRPTHPRTHTHHPCQSPHPARNARKKRKKKNFISPPPESSSRNGTRKSPRQRTDKDRPSTDSNLRRSSKREKPAG
ncbi:hypothetical protein P153DRAFT_98398 [Dothidotthia symphoricarpi CBS 119687]|uniref:Uncharacterized protein n=1 Tax=Dothidotthia symphoricarpi CBS 119687 TaxID=1392245 RepID=A0A6A6ARH1_9PLEO|nr:uncharacterized protein P153DRAFT_98398 [Dothidotthia symphoricarpi CBS 119687]KAF2133768.1 hypothetical protein P153DRAFT_98398 [Dothidotthia symphoricarpi CBS 119687]